MRTTLIHQAHDKVSNRYHLCQLASRVTRRIHFVCSDTQTAINDSFVSIAGGPKIDELMAPQSCGLEPQL